MNFKTESFIYVILLVNIEYMFFTKKAKDLDFYSPFLNAKNREENLFIKKGGRI